MIRVLSPFSALRSRLSVLGSPRAKIRALALVNVMVLAVGVLFSSFLPLFSSQQYGLTPQMYSLVGKSRDDTGQYLSLNKQGTAYNFAVPSTTKSGTSKHTGRVDDAYTASLPTDASQGITVTDSSTQIAVTLVPEFHTTNGQKVDGDHLVYLSGANKLVYTLKYNGLKEDIIIPKFQRDELSFSFTLRLPAGVEARLDQQGNIGIYSSDPTLFGDISFGTDEDRAKVEKARMNGDKNHLVMTIPYPVIKDASGQTYTDRSVFELSDKRVAQSQEVRSDLPAEIPRSLVTTNDYTLTLNANQLKDLPYPISLDPTFQVESASNFEGVTAERGAEIDADDGIIRRRNLSGGVLEGWAAVGAMPAALKQPMAATYNGYLYVAGGLEGTSGGGVATVRKYTIDSTDGTVGTEFDVVTPLQVGTSGDKMIAYNGFLYVVGLNSTSRIDYVRINSDDGSLGTWQTGPTATGSEWHSMDIEVYNGRLYAFGGVVGPSYSALSKFWPINGDGSLGTVVNTETLPRAYIGMQANAYNGFMYLTGGFDVAVGGFLTNVYYTKINDDGTLGAWIDSPNGLQVARNSHSGFIVSGYLYAVGGDTDGSGVLASPTDYAQINADGSLGEFRSTASPVRYLAATAQYDGYMYMVGGCTNGDPLCGAGSSVNADIIASKPKPAGELHDSAWPAADSLPSARTGFATVVHNGHIYVVGGCYSGVCGASSVPGTEIRYAAISSTGALTAPAGGTSCTLAWCTTTQAIPAGRSMMSAVVDSGNLYIVGGCSSYNASAQCDLPISSVYWAPIASNGNITVAFTNVTPTGTYTPPSRYAHGSAVYNGYLYLWGGCGNTAGFCPTGNMLNNTSFVQLNTAGGLVSDNPLCAGTDMWCQTGDMTSGRAGFGYTMNGNVLYAAGGVTPTEAPTASVEYGVIDPSTGAVTWTTTSSFTGARYFNNLEIHNGYLYVLAGCAATGGSCGGTYYNTVQYARISSTGAVASDSGCGTAWCNTKSFTTGRQAGGATTANGILYVLGGIISGGGSAATVEYQHINNGGSGQFSGWTTDSTDQMAVARFGHATVVHNGFIYVMGGCSSSGCSGPSYLQSGQYASVNANGTIGAWQNLVNMPEVRSQMGATVHNGYIYLLGGANNSNYSSNVYYAKIESNGSLATDADGANPGCGATTWCDEDNFSTARYGAVAGAYNNFLYIAGGCSAGGCSTYQDDVQYAAIDQSDGSIDSWAATTDVPVPIHAAGGVVYRDYIYVVGGETTGGVLLNTVYYAQLSPSGGVSGGWRTDGHRFPNARTTPSVAASHGYLYVLGGTYSGDSQADTHFASISSNGILGVWQRGTNMNQDRDGVQSVIANGGLYIVGGADSGTVRADTIYTSLESIPRAGSFSRRYDFDVGVKPTNLITRGNGQTGVMIDLNYSSSVACSSAFDNDQNDSDIGYTGANALDLSLGSSRSLAQCFFLRYTIDDSRSAVFPDTGNESTITDFDLYYTANPGRRLRGGRTFTGGVDRGLDAAP